MEEKILKMMKSLECTREEALQLIEDDKEIDRMTSIKQVDSDLSDEQRKATKKARQGERKIVEKVKKEKKIDQDKRDLFNAIIQSLPCEYEIIGEDREAFIFFNDRKFKIVLSVPRK